MPIPYTPPDWIQTHPEEGCELPCVIHGPSEHLMSDWPARMRLDGMKFPLVERFCKPHGTGHPDPDSLSHLIATTGDKSWGVHGCCGCCVGNPGWGADL